MFHTLKKELSAAGLATGVGDEGLAPNLSSTRDALDFSKAIEKAGYAPGDDIHRRTAATEYFKDGAYVLSGEGVTCRQRKTQTTCAR